jgi:hypothetical protein
MSIGPHSTPAVLRFPRSLIGDRKVRGVDTHVSFDTGIQAALENAAHQQRPLQRIWRGAGFDHPLDFARQASRIRHVGVGREEELRSLNFRFPLQLYREIEIADGIGQHQKGGLQPVAIRGKSNCRFGLWSRRGVVRYDSNRRKRKLWNRISANPIVRRRRQ